MTSRLVSLDQFRGYTVLGMCIVNFLGSFAAIPAVFKHHNTYCSYADTIMPQFFFAVGFAYRLTFLRRMADTSVRSVHARFSWRNLKLILFGGALYLTASAVGSWNQSSPPDVAAFLSRVWREDLFQTLVHIGLTALWILPVIDGGVWKRLAFASGSAALHLGLSHWFYYDWVNAEHGIDGGPLGFLTWTIPMIAGSLAHDLLARYTEARASVRPLLLWGCVVMALGYAFSCLNMFTPPNTPSSHPGAWLVEPPFMPPTHPVNLWTMSQRAGSVSYMLFGAGFSLALSALFVWACDVRGWQLGMWRTFGTNALAGYLIQEVVRQLVEPLKPMHAPLWLALGELVLFVAICYGAVRLLEKKNIYWRM